MIGLSIMQRFTLLHDGSVQGWQATYLAFHVTAQLGAPLQVLHIDPSNDGEAIALRAAHVETGGRAAGVAIETHLLSDFSLDTLKENITAIDGLFTPQRLVADGETVSLFLDAFSCPLWSVSTESKLDDASVAVLVNDPKQDVPLISYAKSLSQRLQQSLTAFVQDDQFEATLDPELSGLKWMALPVFSSENIAQALERLQVGLLIASSSNTSLIGGLSGNFVICPKRQDA
jgi:hypothetical protein